jgi:hypothetical protein
MSFTFQPMEMTSWKIPIGFQTRSNKCTWATFAIDPVCWLDREFWELIMDSNNLNGMIPPEIALLCKTLSEYCLEWCLWLYFCHQYQQLTDNNSQCLTQQHYSYIQQFKWNHSMELGLLMNIDKFITLWTHLQCIAFLFSMSCSSLLLEYFVLRAWQFYFKSPAGESILTCHTLFIHILIWVLWILGLTAFAIE